MISLLISLITVLTLLNNEKINFNFKISHKYMNENLISTFDDILVIDTQEGSKSVELTFTKDEIRLIKKKFDDLDIAKTDFEFLKKEYLNVSTISSSYIVVQDGDAMYTYSWKTNNVPIGGLDIENNKTLPIEGFEEEFERFMKLLEFEDYVEKIIRDKGIF